MEIFMDLKETYDTSKPSFLRHANQSDAAMGASGVETPGDAQKAIGQFTREVQLYKEGAGWFIDENNGGERRAMVSGHWDPQFRVKGFKVYFDVDTLFVQWVYDTPFSSKVVGTWATGIVHPGHITRVWTGDPAMIATNISIFG